MTLWKQSLFLLVNHLYARKIGDTLKQRNNHQREKIVHTVIYLKDLCFVLKSIKPVELFSVIWEGKEKKEGMNGHKNTWIHMSEDSITEGISLLPLLCSLKITYLWVLEILTPCEMHHTRQSAQLTPLHHAIDQVIAIFSQVSKISSECFSHLSWTRG